MTRESMEYDVVIVGGGPSGLTTAIKLKQLDSNLNICLLEKASEIGAHILSGNVFETRALDELLPNWRELNAPIKTKVSKEPVEEVKVLIGFIDGLTDDIKNKTHQEKAKDLNLKT